MQVAFADIPRKASKALTAVYGSGELEFVYVPDIVAPGTDDGFWAERFRQLGGRITLSGDKNIAKRPHQIIAFQRNELITFFMEPPWSSAPLHAKAAHLIYWWPAISKQIDNSSVGDVWQVPYRFESGDMKSLRIPEDAIAKITERNAIRAVQKDSV
jgi:hypothetical protein